MTIKPVSKVAVFLLVFFVFVNQTKSQTIHKWEVFSISFESKNKIANPYAEIPVTKSVDLLEVHFKGIEGEAKGKEIKLTGFWNGANEWRVNFSAPFSGKWEYKSVSAEKTLNGKTGKIEVIDWSSDELNANPTRRGLVQVNQSGENAGHYFQYADGKPFLWIADTWWNWTKRTIQFETFKKLVNNRAAKGFNIGQLFVPGNGWGRESSILDRTYSELDTERMKEVEQMIAYANSKGITVWIHGWWSRPDLNKTIGEEKMKRWWRYLVHRLGAYNVIWVLAGEYNMHNNGGFELDFWKELVNMVKSEDPYNRIVGLHNTPPFWDGGAEAPQWSTGEVLHNEQWLDYNQSQTGHGKYANEMIPVIIKKEYQRKPSKPIVVTEPWYEFVEGNPTGQDIRLAAWGSILSGAAGHTYGGGHVWLGSVPEAPSGSGGAWPIEIGAELSSFNYEGAVSMQHLSSFFKNIDWWKMSPHPELVNDYPQPFCLAIPGKEYIVYLRYGGMINLNIGEKGDEKEFSYYWYNPVTGESMDKKQIKGNKTLQFTAPGMYPGTLNYSDWVLHVYTD